MPTGSNSTRKALGRRGGFSLVETTVSTLLTSILLFTSVSTVAFVGRVLHRQGSGHRAAQIAQLLFTELGEKGFEDPNQTASFGVETGETTSNRSTLDDVDDYNGLELIKLTDRSGVQIPGTDGWTGKFVVQYATLNAPETVSMTKSTLKRVELRLQDASSRSYSYSMLRSASGPLLFAAPSSSETLQTSVRFSTFYDNVPWEASARLNNQQAVTDTGTRP